VLYTRDSSAAVSRTATTLKAATGRRTPSSLISPTGSTSTTSSTSAWRDDALIEIALRALSSDDVHVVATTVAHDPERFEVPANAHVERWLPHGLLMRKAACVVCHGGMGITQRALAAGVPVCVVPFGRDQTEVAGRVTAAGAGTQVLPDALTLTTLRAAIHDAMNMRTGAERVAAGFARAGGAPAAADALELLLGALGGNEHRRAVSAHG
jgi:MGT family glycosyltransferase